MTLNGNKRSCAPWRALFVQPVLALFVLLAALSPLIAEADERVGFSARQQPEGYGRLIVDFLGRLDLPQYTTRYENNVLALEFAEPLDVELPDMAVAMPDFVAVGRIDPDRRGLRFGMRQPIKLNTIEAGEKLFVDILPSNWRGLPPGLPPETVRDLADRAKRAAELAAEERHLALAKRLRPRVDFRIGRNPTFMRLQFDWTVDTTATFTEDENDGTKAVLGFNWPVPIELYDLVSELPPQLISARNEVGKVETSIAFEFDKGVAPRFYQLTPRRVVLDIDIAPEDGLQVAIDQEAAREQLQASLAAAAAGGPVTDPETGEVIAPASTGPVVRPQVTNVGNTVRIAFPFEEDTPAAVFRRGDTVWMVFDTDRTIAPPPESAALRSIASGVEVIATGDARVVRLDLSDDRLTTLASEGRAWVVSLGDVLLNATEPLTLSRQRNEYGEYEMIADLRRPGKVHTLVDPEVGDQLAVVTVLPPARGLTRNQSFVDFDALRSAHGLIVRPNGQPLDVSIDAGKAIIRQDNGLILSAVEGARTLDAASASEFREAFIDFASLRADNPGELLARYELAMNNAAEEEGRARDVARFDLAEMLVANQLSYEAIGVLKVLQEDLQAESLRKKIALVRAIADTLAGRNAEAIQTLTGGSFPQESDALMWRTMARVGAGDFAGARNDALAAEPVIISYPNWIADRFTLAAARAAVETRDATMALRLLDKIDFSTLDDEQISVFELLQGRVAELEGHADEALDHYGRVLAMDIRPTRAEAVYQTLRLLDANNRIDLPKATETLAAEAMMWRGDRLEAEMQQLLAQLYIRNGDYRMGFETVRDVASRFPDTKEVDFLLSTAQQAFEDLFLNGGADRFDDLDALALYYDYRSLTPPGARGDEMIRNLARRLVKVDLLDQAGDLLQYQVESRLDGVARAQVAADLAIIRIADRNPEEALRALNASRFAELPPTLDRQRRVLEARALIDAGREELALDLLSELNGRDIEMLRVDGFWNARNYLQAANLLEVMFTPHSGDAQMTRNERMNIVKAAVGYVLAGDKISLSRLRSKFSSQMANSAEWPLFEYVTRDIVTQSREFRQVASEVASLDSLGSFLDSYRQLYAGDGITPSRTSQGSAV